jgi:hypothetical protein
MILSDLVLLGCAGLVLLAQILHARRIIQGLEDRNISLARELAEWKRHHVEEMTKAAVPNAPHAQTCFDEAMRLLEGALAELKHSPHQSGWAIGAIQTAQDRLAYATKRWFLAADARNSQESSDSSAEEQGDE